MRKVFGALVLASCVMSCGPIENRSPVSSTIEIAKTEFATRIYLDEDACLVPPQARSTRVALPFVAALGLFVPAVTSMITAGLEQYLKEREAALTGHHVGATSGMLIAIEQQPRLNMDLGTATHRARCLTVVRGRFGDWPAEGIRGERPGSKLTQDVLKRAGLTDYPDFYLAVDLSMEVGRTSADEKNPSTPISLIVRPALLHFGRTVAGRTAGDSKTINILIVMDTKPVSASTLDPAKVDAGKVTGVIPLQFEKVKIGTELQRNLISGREVRLPLTLIGNGKVAMPINIAAYVEETEVPTGFEKIVVAAYGGAKGDINKGLQELLKQLLGTPAN